MNKRKQLIENYEAVEAFWSEVNKRKELPETAVLSMPEALSRDTKNKLSKLKFEDAVEIMSQAIKRIDDGSIKTLDCEVRKRLIDN